MTSNVHELLVELFRVQPSLAPELLAGALGVPVPPFAGVRLEAGDLTDVQPTEYRADAVVVLTDDAEPVLAVVVEVQLGRDGGKRWSWPVYLATLRARLKCPVELLVVCPDRAVAAWCATPFTLGVSGLLFAPLVLGPDLVPVMTDVEQANRRPELAVLSAMAHGADHNGVLDVLWAALPVVEKQHRFGYLRLVYAVLPAVARSHLEELMKTKSDEELDDLAQWFVAQGEAKGEAKGKAADVLAILDARRVAVPDRVRERITGCSDLAELDVWVRRAAVADTIDDLGV